MKFLEKHCQMAWEMAVHHCNLLCSGLTDVTQRKLFISSLTNAIELGFKQILIDLNDKNVINQRKLCNHVLLSNFNSASNLNSYFSFLSPTDLAQFYTANISDIVDISTNGITDQLIVKGEIKLLLKLRNMETHFYIDETSYLSFAEFKQLLDLVERIQNYFILKDIIHHTGFGKPLATDKLHASYFDFDISSFNSYRDLIINSKININLANQFPLYEGDMFDLPNGWWFYVTNVDDLYSIAYEIFMHHGTNDGDGICMDFLMNQNEFYRRFVLMVDNGVLRIDKHDEVVECENGTERSYLFVIVSKNKSSLGGES